MYIQGLTSTLVGSLLNVWIGVINFIPKLIGALIVFIIGLIIATVFGSVIEQIIRAIKLDSLLRKMGVSVYIERSGMNLNSARFFGRLVYWFFVIVFILAVSNILGLEVFSSFLGQVLIYIPNVIVSVLIMLATLILARFLKGLTSASVMSAKLHASKFLGSFVWWVVVVFGFITALMQLGINVYILQTLITGLIAMLALAGGIAFGMGGKDYAARLLEKFRQQTE